MSLRRYKLFLRDTAPAAPPARKVGMLGRMGGRGSLAPAMGACEAIIGLPKREHAIRRGQPPPPEVPERVREVRLRAPCLHLALSRLCTVRGCRYRCA